jgi:hypothetical protein
MKSITLFTLVTTLLLCGNANAKESPQIEDSPSVDTTKIVVTALVLGFSYGVMNSFRD